MFYIIIHEERVEWSVEAGNMVTKSGPIKWSSHCGFQGLKTREECWHVHTAQSSSWKGENVVVTRPRFERHGTNPEENNSLSSHWMKMRFQPFRYKVTIINTNNLHIVICFWVFLSNNFQIGYIYIYIYIYIYTRGLSKRYPTLGQKKSFTYLTGFGP